MFDTLQAGNHHRKTVEDFEWDNPHCWLTIVVMALWEPGRQMVVRGPEPFSMLARKGWSKKPRSSLETGLSIRYYPSKERFKIRRCAHGDFSQRHCARFLTRGRK